MFGVILSVYPWTCVLVANYYSLSHVYKHSVFSFINISWLDFLYVGLYASLYNISVGGSNVM
jgi:hypothetical protein